MQNRYAVRDLAVKRGDIASNVVPYDALILTLTAETKHIYIMILNTASTIRGAGPVLLSEPNAVKRYGVRIRLGRMVNFQRACHACGLYHLQTTTLW